MLLSFPRDSKTLQFCWAAPIIVFLLVFGRFWLATPVDPDLFARVAVGELTAANGTVPLHDVFAFTPTKARWIDHEWLAGVIFFFTVSVGGDALLFLMKVLGATLSLVLLALAQRNVLRRGDSTESGAADLWLGTLAVFISLVWHTTVRSQLFTYLFLPFVLLAITDHNRSERTRLLWTLPPLFAFWANCHGGFVVGLGFLGIHLVSRWRQGNAEGATALILFLSAAATLINPYGTEYWSYLIEALSMPRSIIPEWAPVSIASANGLFVIGLAALTIFGWRLAKVPIGLERGLLLLVSFYFGMRHVRLLPIFFMILAVYYADCFQALARLAMPLVRYGYIDKLFRIALLFALVSAFSVCMLFFLSFGAFRLDYSAMPVAATEWLARNRSGGKILSSYRHGNYLLWRLYPEFKIAIDGRYEEVYSDETFQQSVAALDVREKLHEDALRAVAPDFIVLDRRLTSAEDFKHASAEWHEIYRDPRYSVLSREMAQRIDADGTRFPKNMWVPARTE